METKKIHVGKIVETAFNQSGMSKSEFAKLIGIQNQNLNRYFANRDWSVIKLIEAGKALNYDFSELFSIKEKAPQKTKVVLHIEVGDEKMNDVLKFIEDKNLYNILSNE